MPLTIIPFPLLLLKLNCSLEEQLLELLASSSKLPLGPGYDPLFLRTVLLVLQKAVTKLVHAYA